MHQTVRSTCPVCDMIIEPLPVKMGFRAMTVCQGCATLVTLEVEEIKSMSEERPAHDGLDIPDDQLIQGIIRDSYKATPPEEMAADQLVNLFDPQEILDACEGSDIPTEHVHAVAKAVGFAMQEAADDE